MSDSDSSSGDDMPVTQATQSAIDFDSNEIKTIISDTLQYVITTSQKKLPIKKQNLSKDCLRGKGRQWALIMKKVNEELDNIFGMKLVPVPDKSVPQYILINILDTIDIPYFEKSPEDYLLSGILLPVLSVIFMLKGKTKEDVIYSFLKTLGFDIESNQKLTPLNYTLKQLLTNLWVKQLYLEYYKDDEQVYVFNWGFRSECEIDKLALLTSITQILDSNVSPESWFEQYDMATSKTPLTENRG